MQDPPLLEVVQPPPHLPSIALLPVLDQQGSQFPATKKKGLGLSLNSTPLARVSNSTSTSPEYYQLTFFKDGYGAKSGSMNSIRPAGTHQQHPPQPPSPLSAHRYITHSRHLIVPPRLNLRLSRESSPVFAALEAPIDHKFFPRNDDYVRP